VRRLYFGPYVSFCRQIFEAFKKVILQRTYQVCLARDVSGVKAYRHVREFFKGIFSKEIHR
jgi:hypothetical protein